MIAPLLAALLLQAAPPAERPFRAGEGYAFTPAQVEAMVKASAERAVPGMPRGTVPPGPPAALLAPHDDHALAGPLYLPAMRRVSAPRLILFGVAHRAWRWGIQDALIFDGFAAWRGPLGPLPVDASLREALRSALPAGAVLTSNDHHAEEHSLAALVPWIQSADPTAAIVPILVPAMPWERMEELAERLAGAAAAVCRKEGWALGRDLQILLSNDAVHYGDQGWGGKDHAPYGVGTDGLAKARANDRRLIESYLEGPIRPERLRGLLYELVDAKDWPNYRVPWCGRFALPFGLEFTRRLAEKMGLPVPEGKLLAYSTSVELGQLEIKDLPPTAPSNLRHWVGYAAMGWWPPAAPSREGR